MKLASVLKDVKAAPFDPPALFLHRQSIKKVLKDLYCFRFSLLLLHRRRNVSLVEYFVIRGERGQHLDEPLLIWCVFVGESKLPPLLLSECLELFQQDLLCRLRETRLQSYLLKQWAIILPIHHTVEVLFTNGVGRVFWEEESVSD